MPQIYNGASVRNFAEKRHINASSWQVVLLVWGENLQYVESDTVSEILQMYRSFECCKVVNFRLLQQEILGIDVFSTLWSQFLTAFSDLIVAYYNMYHQA